jgi:hypothetical protein
MPVTRRPGSRLDAVNSTSVLGHSEPSCRRGGRSAPTADQLAFCWHRRKVPMAWCRPYGPQSAHEVETVTAQTRSPCANVGVHPGPRRRAVRAGRAFRSALILALYRGVCRNLRGRSYRGRLDVGARAFATRWAAFLGRPDFCAVGHWVLAGLDRGRLHWSDGVPIGVQLGALLLVGMALCVIRSI